MTALHSEGVTVMTNMPPASEPDADNNPHWQALCEEAKAVARDDGHASNSSIQRKLNIPYNAASSLVNCLRVDRIIGLEPDELGRFPLIAPGKRDPVRAEMCRRAALKTIAKMEEIRKADPSDPRIARWVKAT
jgi:hypothetical protein